MKIFMLNIKMWAGKESDSYFLMLPGTEGVDDVNENSSE